MGPRSEGGFTYLELVATAIILMIVASAVLPVARVSYRRAQELELRRNLRQMRAAIDQYRSLVAQGRIGGTDLKLGSEGCPPDLETLVKGVNQVGSAGAKLKFLRRIPVDPMTGTTDWGLRSIQDDPDSTSWGGGNVFDVFSKSQGTALDGTKYSDW